MTELNLPWRLTKDEQDVLTIYDYKETPIVTEPVRYPPYGDYTGPWLIAQGQKEVLQHIVDVMNKSGLTFPFVPMTKIDKDKDQ